MALDLSALDDEPISELSAETQKLIETAPKAPIGDFEEDNIRFEDDDPNEFAAFVEDVRAHGILQPLIVCRVPETGKLRIRFGHWRYRAGVEIGLPELPYLITEDPRHFTTYAQFSENARRRPMTPLETAVFIQARLVDGEKKKQIASRMKIDPSAITHLLALVEAPDFLLNLYHSRKCRSPQYLYELRKLHEQNPEIVERRCAQADEIDRKLVTAIEQEINPPALAPSEPTDVREILDNIKNNPSGSGPSEGGTEQISGVKAQHLPSHNPALEKESGKQDDPNKIKKPLLLGTYQGRDVMILLSQRPTASGLVVVRYEDGSGDEEVTIGEITLTMLSDSKA